jgi:hypothetical protein
MYSLEASPSSKRGRNVSHAPPLPLRFLHIRDPGEAKLPSHRKAVHTHAALYQASQDRTERESHVPRRRSRKRKRKDHWPGENMIIELGHAQNIHLERRETLPPAELSGQLVYQYHFPSIGLLSAGRVDPFRTYPVPWDPFIPQLVDHCSFFQLAFLWNSRISTD